MNNISARFLLAASLIASWQQPMRTSTNDSGVMLAAASHNARMLGGPSKESTKDAVFVEPIARLTPSGEWQSLPCFADRDGRRYNENQRAACLKFEQEYLRKPHTYTVVSAEGRGTTINAPQTILDECFNYTVKGTSTEAGISASAIVATSIDSFSDGPVPQLLTEAEAQPFVKAFAVAAPGGLDSTLHLKVISLRLEGQDLILVQRSHVKPAGGKLIFAIGKIDQGRFQVLLRKEDVGDQDETVVGTVHLTNGRDFLITTVIDTEGQWFRVYGIREGKLMRLFSGGGSSC